MAYNAQIIRDSISPDGHRLTTMQATYPRFVHSEFMTHRVFSRNAASSRAIPVAKQIRKVLEDPAMPVEWGMNQSGMQAGDAAPDHIQREAQLEWLNARDAAVEQAQALNDLGLHKQIVNRILEPFVWMTVVVSATDWDGFWQQRASRYSPLAQPELRYVADMMLEAYEASEPAPLAYDEWHTPYVDDDELKSTASPWVAQQVSAARCARVSYLTQDGNRDPMEDLRLYERLVSARPLHASPLEHVATPVDSSGSDGNFMGWRQLRHEVERDAARDELIEIAGALAA